MRLERAFSRQSVSTPAISKRFFQLGVLLKSLQNLEGAAEALQGTLRLRPGDIKAQMI